MSALEGKLTVGWTWLSRPEIATTRHSTRLAGLIETHSLSVSQRGCFDTNRFGLHGAELVTLWRVLEAIHTLIWRVLC